MADNTTEPTATPVEEQIVLACEIPENAQPGTTFHVQLDSRFFEVMTPEGAVPGQTIHIVVPAAAPATSFAQSQPVSQPPLGEKEMASPQYIYVADNGTPDANAQLGIFTQLRLLGDRAVAHAKNLDEQYNITNKVGEIAKPAVDKMKAVDEKYKITEKTSAVGAQAKAKLVELDEKYELTNKTSALISNTRQKISDLDQNHKVTEKISSASSNVVAMAREIDSRYAVSATAARLVHAGAAAVISAYNKAVEYDQQHRISERAAASIAASAAAVAKQVNKFSGAPASSAAQPVDADAADADSRPSAVEGVNPMVQVDEKSADARSL